MDLLTVLLVALLSLVIGFALGRLVDSLGGGDVEESPPEEGEDSRHWTDILRVWRDRQSEKLVVKMDGKAFEWSYDLKPTQRNRLNQILRDIQSWLEPLAISREDEISAQAGMAPVSASEEEPRVSFSPINVLVRAMQADISKSSPEPRSIAAQIDEILQELVIDSPLGDRAVRLMEFPGKGMVVMIGMDQYEEVDDVPDEEVKELIRAAVAEWERRVEE
jgi:hypothetical protein